jgi:hypothetical protein
VIEGLLHLPWLKEMASRDEKLPVADCDKCKSMTPKTQRQYLGCGYEPPLRGVRLTMWNPPSGAAGFKGVGATVCAGYTTSLPEVQEVALDRIHWEHGSLRDACDGDLPTEETRAAVVILEGQYNAVRRWIMTPQKDGGGGA